MLEGTQRTPHEKTHPTTEERRYPLSTLKLTRVSINTAAFIAVERQWRVFEVGDVRVRIEDLKSLPNPKINPFSPV